MSITHHPLLVQFLFWSDVCTGTSSQHTTPTTSAKVMTHAVPDGAQFVEGLDVEPGALVSSCVQHHPHGVFLQQSRQTLVHRQILVALQVEELCRNRLQ